MSIYKFGNNLTKIRENKKISQEDLAHLSGISRRSISRIENGLIKEPSIDTLLKLSASLDFDLVDMYIKNNYESHYLYRDLISSFDILSSFKSREEILLLEKKLNILENDPSFKGKDYELALIRLFIKSLKTPKLLSLEEEFEDITSFKINKNKIFTGDLTFFETRLLVNVCNENGGYKNIAKEDLLDIIISKTDNCTLKFLSYNSLINSIYVNKECKDALSLVNEAIDESKKNRFIEGNSLLYYLQFLCRYGLGDERFTQSLDYALLFSTYTGLDNLKNLIEEKSKNLIE